MTSQQAGIAAIVQLLLLGALSVALGRRRRSAVADADSTVALDRSLAADLITRILWIVAYAADALAAVLTTANVLTLSARQQPPLGLSIGVAVLTLMGLGTVLWSDRLVAGSRTNVDANGVPALVTTGPFSLTRHPGSLATVIVLVTVSLNIPDALTIVGAAIAIVAATLHVRLAAEPRLRQRHGDEYHVYAMRVGRLVPLVGEDRLTAEEVEAIADEEVARQAAAEGRKRTAAVQHQTQGRRSKAKRSGPKSGAPTGTPRQLPAKPAGRQRVGSAGERPQYHDWNDLDIDLGPTGGEVTPARPDDDDEGDPAATNDAQ